MIFYHGTSKENWDRIQKDGILWGKGMSYRYTYLSPHIEVAKEYGDIILEIDYNPVGVDGTATDNYGFNPPEGQTCWQFSVFIPIEIKHIRRLNEGS